MLEMHGISKIYRTDLIETHALRDFSLKVGDGEFVAVTGPSGSGKTTFMNLAGLLETFDTGTYRLDGEDVSRLSDEQRSKLRNEKIGFIFQSFNLIPDLDIFDNVDVPLRYRGLAKKDRELMVKFARDLQGVVQKVGKERGYTLIVDARAGLIYGAPEADLTEEVIKEFDAASRKASKRARSIRCRTGSTRFEPMPIAPTTPAPRRRASSAYASRHWSR